MQDEVLKLLPDTQRIAKRFLSARAGLDDVVRVYQAARILPKMLDLSMQVGRRKDKGQETYTVEDEALAALMDETYVAQLSVRVRSLESGRALSLTTSITGGYRELVKACRSRRDHHRRFAAKQSQNHY